MRPSPLRQRKTSPLGPGTSKEKSGRRCQISVSQPREDATYPTLFTVRMVNLLEADDLLFVQYLDRVEPQAPSALSYAPGCQSLGCPHATERRNITEVDATKATRTEGSMDNKVLNGICGLGPSLKCS